MTNKKQWQRDLALVQQTLNGDEIAVAEFADRMKCIPKFLGRMNHQVHHSLSVERLQEAGQEVALRVWRDRGAFNGQSVIETWVYRYSVHVFQESLMAQSKAEYRRTEHEEIHSLIAADLDAEDQLHLETEAAKVRGAMHHLIPAQMELIERKLFQDQAFSAIARDDDKNINTVKAQYYRALTAVKRALLADDTAKSSHPTLARPPRKSPPRERER